MTTILTQRNRVITEPPEPDDVFVRVSLIGMSDKPGVWSPRHLPFAPISSYQEQVDFAVGIADQFVHPLYVVPVNPNEFLHTARFDPYRRMLANMNDQERGEIRQICIASAASVMRDCDDPALRADCYHILVQLKVIRP